MGYYDSAQKFQPMTQPIYNVKDMLLSGQAAGEALKGSSKLMQENAKAKQQLEANQYVSGLLGKATPENYQQQLLQAGSMAPYASPEMIAQVRDTRGQMQYDQGVKTHASERAEDMVQRGVENTHWDKKMEQELLFHKDNLGMESQKLAEMIRGNKSQEALAAQRNKIQSEQNKIDNMYKKWGIAQTLDTAGYEVDKKTGMPVFTGKSQPYLLSRKSAASAAMLDPTVVRDAYNNKNTFGGWATFDTTTDNPVQMYNQLVGRGKISAADKPAWYGLLTTDPEKAREELMKIK